jgi:hypothetical protein
MEQALDAYQNSRWKPHVDKRSKTFLAKVVVGHGVLVFCLLTFMILTFEACDGGGDGDDNGGSVAACSATVPQTCANVDGFWDVTEEVTATCTTDGESETDTVRSSGRIRLNQNGCALSYTVPRLNVLRTGVIDGTSICLSGPFAQAVIDDVSFTENIVTIEGELVDNTTITADGTGRATGSVEDRDFVCNAQSTANFTRVGAAQVGAASLAESSDAEPALSYFDDAVQLLPIVMQ